MNHIPVGNTSKSAVIHVASGFYVAVNSTGRNLHLLGLGLVPTLTLTQANPNLKTAFFEKNIDPDPGPGSQPDPAGEVAHRPSCRHSSCSDHLWPLIV